MTVTADRLTRDLCLFVDRLHPGAFAAGQMVTLLPGESATFTVTCPEPLDLTPEALQPLLRSVGHVTANHPARTA